MAGPLEELVKRIQRRIERFKEEHGLAEVEVTIELARRVAPPAQDALRRARLRLRQLLPARRRGRARRRSSSRSAPSARSGSARRGRSRPSASRAPATARLSGSQRAELERVPGRRRGELEQRAAALRLRVGELAALVVPGDLEQALLHAVVEVRAAEHELAEPVDERLAVDEREALPVADEVRPERAARLRDPAVRGELDEVGDLVVVEVVRRDEPQPDGRGARPAPRSRAPPNAKW